MQLGTKLCTKFETLPGTLLGTLPGTLLGTQLGTQLRTPPDRTTDKYRCDMYPTCSRTRACQECEIKILEGRADEQIKSIENSGKVLIYYIIGYMSFVVILTMIKK